MPLEQIVAKFINSVSGLRAKPRHIRAFVRYNSARKLRNFLSLNREFRQRKTVLSVFPFILNVEPTNICNLKCPLCPTGAGDYGRPKGSMGFHEFKQIINQIGDYLYEVNLFNFGEPLLNKEVFQMTRYAHEHNIATCISTNLNVLTEEGAEALVRSGLDHLILSIDGLTPDIYSKYRVGGDFLKVVENLKQVVEWKQRLHSRSPFIEWQFLVFKHNEHEVDRVEQFATALGANGVSIRNSEMVSVDGNVPDATNGLVLEDEERKQYHDENMGSGKPCNYLWHTITINPDGGVSPCCLAYRKENDFGDFIPDKSSLREIWNNAKFQAARRIFCDATLPSDQNILCSSCYVARGFIHTQGVHPSEGKVRESES